LVYLCIVNNSDNNNGASHNQQQTVSCKLPTYSKMKRLWCKRPRVETKTLATVIRDNEQQTQRFIQRVSKLFQPWIGSQTTVRVVTESPRVYFFYTNPVSMSWTLLDQTLAGVDRERSWVCFDFHTKTLIVALVTNSQLSAEIRNQRLLLQRRTDDQLGCVPFGVNQWQLWSDVRLQLPNDLLAELDHFLHLTNLACYDQVDANQTQVAIHDHHHVWIRLKVSGCLSMVDLLVLISLFPLQLLPPLIDVAAGTITLEWLPPQKRKLIWYPQATLASLTPGLSQIVNRQFKADQLWSDPAILNTTHRPTQPNPRHRQDASPTLPISTSSRSPANPKGQGQFQFQPQPTPSTLSHHNESYSALLHAQPLSDQL
jgi:hypothetical protein